jgi:hypothetical protein
MGWRLGAGTATGRRLEAGASMGRRLALESDTVLDWRLLLEAGAGASMGWRLGLQRGGAPMGRGCRLEWQWAGGWSLGAGEWSAVGLEAGGWSAGGLEAGA